MIETESFEQGYSYSFSSSLQFADRDLPAVLKLATTTPVDDQRLFFLGGILKPELAAALMLATSDVSMQKYYTPFGEIKRMLRASDPVISASGKKLRFESFSRCCGVYARAEFLPEMLAPETFVKGATNVDFNPDTRAGLARIRAEEGLQLSIAPDKVEFRAERGAAVERKVKLPSRWLRGFAEVQSIMSALKLAATVDGPRARAFLSTIPIKVTAKDPVWITDLDGRIRLSQRPGTGALGVAGLGRLVALKPLARFASTLRIYTGSYGASAFELDFETARFMLVLSGAPARGFSGEGQLLLALATGESEAAAEKIERKLTYEDEIHAEIVAGEVGLPITTVRDAFSMLSIKGVVGFDPYERVYFHRQLPLDRSILAAAPPRLQAARTLAADGEIIIDRHEGDLISARATSEGTEHRVEIDGADFRCTCVWHVRTEGNSGPCKHVLASLIVAKRAHV